MRTFSTATVIFASTTFALLGAIAGWWLMSDRADSLDDGSPRTAPISAFGGEEESEAFLALEAELRAEAANEPTDGGDGDGGPTGGEVSESPVGNIGAALDPAVAEAAVAAASADPDGAGDPDPTAGEDDGEADPLPAEVLADDPIVARLLDLSDIVVADPVGPIGIDLCAGPARLPETPEGCPFGIGGTIVLADGDAPEGLFEPVGGRPPTGLNSLDDSVLNIRTFIRPDVPETVDVSIYPFDPSTASAVQVCDPDSPDTLRSDEVFINGRLRSTIPIDTSGASGAWPYDPAYRSMIVDRAALLADTPHAVCIRWYDESGVDAVLTEWEAVQVLPPTRHRLGIEVLGYGTHWRAPVEEGPEDEIDYIVVGINGCGTEYLEWRYEPDGFNTWFPEPRELCTVEDTSGIARNGGFAAAVAVRQGGRVPEPLVTWVDVSPSELRCRVDCTEERLVIVPMAPILLEGYDRGSFGEAEASETRAGEVRLGLSFRPYDGVPRPTWGFGDPTAVLTGETPREVPPILDSVTVTDVEALLAADHAAVENAPGVWSTARRLRVSNETPVALTVEILAHRGGGVTAPACTASGDPLGAFSSPLGTDHSFDIYDLCLGEYYTARIRAVDADGVEYDVSDRRIARESSNQFRFDTFNWVDSSETRHGYVVELDASVELGEPEPSGNPTMLWVYRVAPLLLQVSGPPFEAEPVSIRTGDVEARRAWDDARWTQHSDDLQVLINTRADDPSAPPPLPLRFAGVRDPSVGLSHGVAASQTMRFTLVIQRRQFDETEGWWGIRSGPYPDRWELSATAGLGDVLSGIVIAAPEGYPRVTISADGPVWFWSGSDWNLGRSFE